MNNSRRSFLGKTPAVVIAVGVGVASGKIVMASPTPVEGTRPLLDAVIEGQARINGSFYAVNDLLLEVLRMVIPHVPIDVATATAKLLEAESYLGPVPRVDPPGCKLPPDWDGGGYGGGD
jgi:hypothetical protein